MKLVLETDNRHTARFVAKEMESRGFAIKITPGVDTLFRVWACHKPPATDESFAARLWSKIENWTIGDGVKSEELKR